MRQRAGEVMGQWVHLTRVKVKMSGPSMVMQKVRQWHRSWLSCLKCSDWSRILRRNVFVRLASPRCRPHHTQQKASQHRKHIKTAIWAPPTLNWIQRAMQHDRFAWTRTLKLFSITQLTNVQQDHKRSQTPSLSVQINSKSLSSVSISSKDSVKFKAVRLLQPPSFFALQPAHFWSLWFSTDSSNSNNVGKKYEVRSTSHFGNSFSLSWHLPVG